MASRPPAFPPDVARRLQESEGSVSFRYTLAKPLNQPPERDTVLMETPNERVLTSMCLDTKLNLRLTRVSCAEGARTVYVPVVALRGARHWDVSLSWNTSEMKIGVRDRLDPEAPVLEGRFPR